MTFQEVALRMFPYWIMGLFMLYATWQSKHKDLLRIEWKPIAKWILFLCGITAYRWFIFRTFAGNEQLHDMTSGAMIIPWQATLTVFWEDACHGLPLAILSRWLGKDKWWKKALTWIAIAIVMVSFGLGHVYQGWIAAAALSFYIPFTFKKGQEVGFGTVMLCHTLYDLVTIVSMHAFLG
jgi:hypothetical protein